MGMVTGAPLSTWKLSIAPPCPNRVTHLPVARSKTVERLYFYHYLTFVASTSTVVRSTLLTRCLRTFEVGGADGVHSRVGVPGKGLGQKALHLPARLLSHPFVDIGHVFSSSPQPLGTNTVLLLHQRQELWLHTKTCRKTERVLLKGCQVSVGWTPSPHPTRTHVVPCRGEPPSLDLCLVP